MKKNNPNGNAPRRKWTREQKKWSNIKKAAFAMRKRFKDKHGEKLTFREAVNGYMEMSKSGGKIAL